MNTLRYIALTHTVSPSLKECELSYLERVPIDVRLAQRQHDQYCQMLRNHDIHVIELNCNLKHPDSTFIEDTAVVTHEIAVLCRMGAVSRMGEVDGIEPELMKYREVRKIKAPGTIEGGDVLQIGENIFIGISPRTNREGIRQFMSILKPMGYQIHPVELKNCLHLKSAVTSLDDETLLVNPDWLELTPFNNYQIVPIHESEPWAANVLRLPDHTIILHSGFIRTIDRIQSLGYQVDTVNISELQRAESALTCSSIIFRE
jgi:dimethylargininase